MKRRVAILIALLILVASGLVHGSWAERWSPATALDEAAARVPNVPLQIGDWRAQTIDADPAVFFQAGARQFWMRSYVNARKKTTLLVILMCGRAGRMSVHTPEICYRGAGYEMEGNPTTWSVPPAWGADLGSFWTARFTKGSGALSDLRLYWSWSAGGRWQASANPRWEYGGEPFLYKLYISHDAPGTATISSDAVQDFFRQLLPKLPEILARKSS
jgi:hypothetical protein